MPLEHKIVLGLDFGTTFTGVAYGTTAGKLQNLETVTNWPESSGASHKTPTRIAYRDENVGELDEDAWGFQVNGRMQSYSWFKLLLSPHVDPRVYEDLSPESVSRGILQLPDWCSAQDVCVDYLKLVCDFVNDLLIKRFTEEALDSLPIEVWMTVPAIWTEAAKNKTMEAAKTAGFASRPRDCIRLIPEPEAAALAVLHPHSRGNSVNPLCKGETFIVCDCGGGTVDLTTYTIESLRPRLKYQEICAGEGAKCGSTFVDRNFDAWMTKMFKNKYTKLSAKRRGPGSKMMDSFERAKLRFGPRLVDRNMEKVKVESVVMDVKSSEFYDREDHTVIFPWKVMKSFFDPVIDRILELVEGQVQQASVKGKEVGRVVLAGGFGDNAYLNYRLKGWCQKRDIRLSCPPNCQAAIMRGAVLRGLLGMRPTSRVARHHYGFSLSLPFRDGIDRNEDLWIDRCDGQRMSYNRMQWLVHKGQDVPSNFLANFGIQREILPDETREYDVIELFRCSEDSAPDHQSSKALKLVGKIQMTFTKADWWDEPPHYNHEADVEVRLLCYDVIMNMNAEEGVLTVKVKNKKRELGHSAIEFCQEE